MVPLLAVALLLAAGISPTLAQYKCANINVALDKRDAIVHPTYYKRRGAPKPVDVYFHVTSTEAHKDRITDTIVDAQVLFLILPSLSFLDNYEDLISKLLVMEHSR